MSTPRRKPSTPVLATILALSVCALFGLALAFLGCHDSRLSVRPEVPSITDATVQLPDTPFYYVTVSDPVTGEALQHFRVNDNPAKSGLEATRTSVSNAIRHAGRMYGRQDIIDRADDVSFAWELGAEDLARRPRGGVTCTCGSLACDPSVCGRNCSGGCGNCLWC